MTDLSYLTNTPNCGFYYHMSINFDKLINKLKSMMESYFNGSITIHFSEGNLMKVEIKEVTRNL